MVQRGVYPAAVTPFDDRGRVDLEAAARLLAWFEASGCAGAVLAGTNGEGPSLSATEKRDFIESAGKFKGKLDLILGVATPSLEEAAWLCRRAAESHAVAALVMPPFYYRDASEAGIREWFVRLLDRSPLPVLVYNFPQKTGITLSPGLIGELGGHPKMAGVKDSSGDEHNLRAYRNALTLEDQELFVGDETLLVKALESGWSGTISGAANVLPMPLSAIVGDFLSGERASAEEKFKLILPLIREIRSRPQPATHKAVLELFGVLTGYAVRPPLVAADLDEALALARTIFQVTGLPNGWQPHLEGRVRAPERP